jgi:hypothetical protein
MSILLSNSLTAFFKSLFVDVAKSQQVSFQETTEFYVVNLLSEFAKSDKLFTTESDGKRSAEALAILYHRALNQQRAERIKTLRQLGDASLYTAGFFAPSLNERLVGSQYYVSMGQNAYGAIAQMSQASAFATVYAELQAQFLAVVSVLKEMGARCLAAQGPAGQLHVLEQWRRNGDERLKTVLLDADLFPKGALPN